jgi:outer membrane protein OmpA-like peptidoglycan-associated protein
MLAENNVGSYMDDQEKALRQRMRGTGIRVSRVGDDMMLILPSDILYAAGGSSLSARATRTIDAIAEVLRHFDKTLVEVNGYTDTTGTPEQNMKLSQARAEGVADVLVSDGVNAARISPRGYGETNLRVPTGDNANEPRNRRVEIRIVPHVGKA